MGTGYVQFSRCAAAFGLTLVCACMQTGVDSNPGRRCSLDDSVLPDRPTTHMANEVCHLHVISFLTWGLSSSS